MVEATFKRGAKLERMFGKVENPKSILRQIGALFVSESQQAFKEQKIGDTKWKERAVPNVYGIVADFAQGKRQPPERRFESRPVLQDTGRLAASIAAEVMSRDTVRIGSNLPYAAVLHAGGKIESETITAQVQKLLGEWLKKDGSSYSAKLGFLLSKRYTGKRLAGEVEARPIVAITKTVREDIKEVVGVEIAEA